MITPAKFLLAAATLAGVSLATAADWTHVMGPTFNRKSAEAAPAPKSGTPTARKVWTVDANGGFSSFVTGDGRVYTNDVADGREAAIALDRATGKKLWEYRMSPAEYRNGGGRNGGKDGPRSTPAFSNGRVFVFDGNFELHALEAATGKLIWKHSLLQEFGGQQIVWSNAQSPLVLEDRVIVSGGGGGQSYLAFRPDNGELICVHCAGMTAKFTGRDRSGMKVLPMNQADAAEWEQMMEKPMACESGCTTYGAAKETTVLELA